MKVLLVFNFQACFDYQHDFLKYLIFEREQSGTF